MQYMKEILFKNCSIKFNSKCYYNPLSNVLYFGSEYDKGGFMRIVETSKEATEIQLPDNVNIWELIRAEWQVTRLKNILNNNQNN